jgi:hypothetical protein
MTTYQITTTSYTGTLDTLGIRTGRTSVSAALSALEQVSGLRGLVTKRGGDGEYYVYADQATADRDDDDSAAMAVIEPEAA